MGIVIDFPMNLRTAHDEGRGNITEPATIVILPVVRVERSPDTPADGVESGPRGTGRKRRRRASRS